MTQFFDQRLRFLQLFRSKAFGESVEILLDTQNVRGVASITNTSRPAVPQAETKAATP